MSNLNKKPLTLQDLEIYFKQDEIGYNARQKLLLKHNAVFYQTIMNTIASKNKVDFPPFGPTSENNLQFQNEKLKILLYAVIEKRTSPDGLELKYPLAQFGVGQAAVSGVRTVASKTAGLMRGVGSLFSKSPQQIQQPTQPQQIQQPQQLQPNLETQQLLKKGGKKNIDLFKKTELVKIAKKNKINLKNKNGSAKTKEELYKSLKTKKLI